MPTLAIGVTLPTLGFDATAIPDVVTAARRCEDLGFESVWIPDLVLGDGTPTFEATVTAAAVAAVTASVKIGFGVLSLPLRATAWIAAQVATLQHLSGNRILLGVGSGGAPDSPFWPAVGAVAQDRGRRTDAALAVLPRLISGEPAPIHDRPQGESVRLAPAANVPPIFVGGTSMAAIRRTVDFGDGWFPSQINPRRLATRVAKLRAAAADRGRSTPSVTLGGHAVVGDDDTARATKEDLVRSVVEDHGLSRDDAETVPLTGRTPEELAGRFAEFASAGADRIVVSPDGPDWLQQCKLIASAASALRRTSAGGRP